MAASNQANTETFYHFTQGPALASIMLYGTKDGLKMGDVPLTVESGFQAVWLTTDPNPDSFGIVDMPKVDKAKKEARITIKISKNDPNLRQYRDVLKMYNVKKKFARIMDKADRGDPFDFWLYRGKIEIGSFAQVDLRMSDGNYKSFDASMKHQGMGDEPWGALFQAFHPLGYCATALLMELKPDPEPGWPDPKTIKNKCANPNCKEDPCKPATLACKRCRTVQYHSRNCQLEHYNEHKHYCRMHVAGTDVSELDRPMVVYSCTK